MRFYGGNYGVPTIDRRDAALPRLGGNVCLFCFEPKYSFIYIYVSVEPTSQVTALLRSYPDTWQHTDCAWPVLACPIPNTPPRGECSSDIRAATVSLLKPDMPHVVRTKEILCKSQNETAIY